MTQIRICQRLAVTVFHIQIRYFFPKRCSHQLCYLKRLQCESSMEEIKNSKVPTIRKLYPIWLEHKSLMSADTYITRVESDWKRYYEDDPIVDIPIDHLDQIELENWVLHLIRDNQMTKTAYYNVSLIIRQVFRFAYDAEIIKENPFERVKKDLFIY